MERMYSILKYSTTNLFVVRAKDKKGNRYYQIWERKNEQVPVAIYVDKSNMKLRDDFPNNIEEYEYFDEIQDIIKFLYDMECRNVEIE